MAIQTQGHVLTNLARFTPSDPSLVAFNPGALTQGASQAFALADQLDKIRAYRAAQQELSDTRIKRVVATNTGYDVTTAQGEKTLRQMPLVEKTENLRFGAEGQLIPKQTEYSLQKLVEDSKSLPIVAEATRDQAVYNSGLAKGNTVNLATLLAADAARNQAAKGEADIANATQATRQEIATQAAAFGLSTATVEQQIKLKQLVDAYNNADNDADRKRLKEEVSILVDMARINQSNAEADYLRGGKGAKPIDITMEEGRIFENLDKLSRSDVGGGKEYRVWKKENVNAETGELIKGEKRPLWWDKPEASPNPKARDLYIREQQLMQALNAIRSGRGEVDVTKDLQKADASATPQKKMEKGPDGRWREKKQ